MARVCHFYAMPWDSILAMPIRAFWSLVKNAIRLQAEHSIRALDVSIASQSPEYAKTLREQYDAQLKPTAKEKEEATGMPKAGERFDPNVDHAAGVAQLQLLQGG